MKRIWLGVGLLVALLVVGVALMQITNRQMETLSQAVEKASETQSWEEAITIVRSAQAQWQQKRQLIAAFSDHADVDGVDQIFAQLEVYQRYGSRLEHAAACAQLSEALLNLVEAHALTWWNLL